MLLSKIIFILMIFTFLASCDTFQFDRTLSCVENNTVQCTQWKDTIILHHHGIKYMACFPASTYVLTPEGPKFISQIQVHDQVLSYNKETGKSNFSEVIAWLHRDTVGVLEYDQIQTLENYTFSASEAHNIGFVNDGEIGFKFAEDLNAGDQLLGFGKNLTIRNSNQLKKQDGLFSPLTAEGNFYIFPQGIKYENLRDCPMALAHSFSKIRNPLNYQKWILNLISFYGILGLNEHQNYAQEIYVHPVTKILRLFLYQSDKKPKYSLRISNRHDRSSNSHEYNNYGYNNYNYGNNNYGYNNYGYNNYGYNNYGYNNGYGYGYNNGYYGQQEYEHYQHLKVTQQGMFALLMINQVVLRSS